jgi:hypothetical protein
MSAFPSLCDLGILVTPSRVICLTSSASHAVNAFYTAGTRDATSVNLIDFLPLVHRADPYHLLFSD